MIESLEEYPRSKPSGKGGMSSNDNSPGTSSSGHVGYGVGQGDSGEDGPARKKVKIPRAKIACIPCRSRRTKCGGNPPGACEHCVEARLSCHWPPEESRPKRGRPPKNRTGSSTHRTPAASAHGPSGGDLDRNGGLGIGEANTGMTKLSGSFNAVRPIFTDLPSGSGHDDEGSMTGFQPDKHFLHTPSTSNARQDPSARSQIGQTASYLLPPPSATSIRSTSTAATLREHDHPMGRPSIFGGGFPVDAELGVGMENDRSSHQTTDMATADGQTHGNSSSAWSALAGEANGNASRAVGRTKRRSSSRAGFGWEHGLLNPPEDELGDEDEELGDDDGHGGLGHGTAMGQVSRSAGTGVGIRGYDRFGSDPAFGLTDIVRRTSRRGGRRGGWTALEDGLSSSVGFADIDPDTTTTASTSGPFIPSPDSSNPLSHQDINVVPADARGLPREPIVIDVLENWSTHFECQFPFLTRQSMERLLDQGHPQAVFLFNAVAAVAARFSEHPEIAVPGLRPHAYGRVFFDRAMSSLGLHLGITSRETLGAFTLLSLAAYGQGKMSDMRMLNGMATKLCLDMGLHLAPPLSISANDSRLDRLLFWSIMSHDTSIAVSEGKQTSINPSEITVPLPTEEDIHPSLASDAEGDDDDAAAAATTALAEMESSSLRSPFPFVAQTVFALSTLNNVLNAQLSTEGFSEPEVRDQLMTIWQKTARTYDDLPLDMVWTGANLQWHYRAGSGPAFLFLHIWNFTIQALRYLVVTLHAHEEFEESGRPPEDPSHSQESWLVCARFVGEMLVLADIVDPVIHMAIPSVSHCFYIAECCFLSDMESSRLPVQATPESMPTESESPATVNPAQSEVSSKSPATVLNGTATNGDHRARSSGGARHQPRKFLAAIAMQNIITLKQGLAKQGTRWKGLDGIRAKFDERLENTKSSNELVSKLAQVVSASRGSDTAWLGPGKGVGKRKRRNFGFGKGDSASPSGTMLGFPGPGGHTMGMMMGGTGGGGGGFGGGSGLGGVPNLDSGMRTGSSPFFFGGGGGGGGADGMGFGLTDGQNDFADFSVSQFLQQLGGTPT